MRSKDKCSSQKVLAEMLQNSLKKSPELQEKQVRLLQILKTDAKRSGPAKGSSHARS